MSSMTESLLLEAQNLHLDGDHDGSIHLLRIVISQCNSDIAAAGGAKSSKDIAWRMRQMAAYQLALSLLQRRGRCWYHMLGIGNGGAGEKVPENKDLERETEADELLWKLGYKLRLSVKAFGYPSCCCRYTTLSPGAPVHVIDDAIASNLFGALQFAFRPESKYWSDFYSKINGGGGASWTRESNGLQSPSKRNQFASHNIILPSSASESFDSDASSGDLLHQMQNASSLIEQVAISARHKLQKRFPNLKDAKSVEVWCHERPPDGCHQLHYDVDEIRLEERRRCVMKSPHIDQAVGLKSDSKRQRIDIIDRGDKNKADGLFSPLVSCILTIYVPNSSDACELCHEYGKGTPTIVCNQSISNIRERQRTTGHIQKSKGWLCYPKPNRLLAFEGSLLHGVVPGIPEPGNCAQNLDNCSSCSSIDSSYLDHNTPTENCHQKRVTLMMGFWGDGVFTQGATDVGPNTPYPNKSKDRTSSFSWANEFLPIKIEHCDLLRDSNPFSIGAAIEVQPLWIPIGRSDDYYREFINGGIDPIQFTGRFFLKSGSTNEIDDGILYP